MARSKKSRSSSRSSGQRDLSTPTPIATEDLYLRPLSVLPWSAPPRSGRRVLTIVEDRRLFNPTRPLVPARTSRRVAPLSIKAKARSKNRAFTLSDAVRFTNPNRVAVCVRRTRRRQVLFAKRATRKGAGARRRRRSFYSGVSC